MKDIIINNFRVQVLSKNIIRIEKKYNGNFLDSKYEIEYYKFSGLIKSMKLLSNDEATQRNENN